MKGIDSFEDKLLESSEFIKKASKTLLSNIGKIIALFVFVLMLALTFTDISFLGLFTEDFASSLLLLITSSYIIYFSLEDAGEKYGEETEIFKKSCERYNELRSKVSGSDIDSLREFCREYSKRDFEYRRKNFLFSKGLSENDLQKYEKGEISGKRIARHFKRYNALKPVVLTPRTLLSWGRSSSRSELENPERRKIPILLLKLIPSTVCMTVTLSVMLSAKDGLTPTDVLNGILKLSALPLVGFKGYSAGYSYVKQSVSLFLETKANILDDFLNKHKAALPNNF